MSKQTTNEYFFMRQALIIFNLIILCLGAQATECTDRFFREDKVNLYLCQNYSNYSEATTLLFKARTKILNDYIKGKIRNGQLKDKKFQIKIYDPILTYEHLELTQESGSYFVNVSGFPTIEQLMIFIEYFTKYDSKSFVANDKYIVDAAKVSELIDSFYRNSSSPDLTMITQTSFPVWSNQNLHLDYQNDNLKYFFDSTPLPIEPTSSLPVKIKDRFLLFQSDAIYVLQGGEIINKLEVKEPFNKDYDIYTFEKWVNICQGGEENWIYSYSYDRNRFYRRKNQND